MTRTRTALPAIGATLLLLAAMLPPAAADPTPQTVFVDFSGIDARGDLTKEQKQQLKDKIKAKLKANLESAVGAGNVDVTDDPAKKAGAARTVEFKDSMGGGAWGDWQPGSDTSSVYVQEYMDDPNVDDAFQTDGKWDIDKLANAMERTAAHELAHSFSVGHNDDEGEDVDKMTEGGGVDAETRATRDWHYDDHTKKTLRENWNKAPCAAAVDYDHKALLTDVWGPDHHPFKPEELQDIDALFSFRGRMAGQFDFGWLGRDHQGHVPGDPDFDLLRGFVYKSSMQGAGSDARMITFLSGHHDQTQFALRGLPGTPWQGMVLPLADGALGLNDLVQQPDGDLVARQVAMTWELDLRSPGPEVAVLLDALAWGSQTNPFNGFTYGPPADRPPVASIAPVPRLECEGGGATVTLDASRSYDPDLRPLSFWWIPTVGTLDDPRSPTPTGRFPLGTTRVDLVVSDGRQQAQASVDVVVVDTVPPKTRATLEGIPGTNGWWRSPVDVKLEATDRCGVKDTWSAVDAAPLERRRDFRLDGDGFRSIRFLSTDIGGNAEREQSLPVNIDTLPPTVGITDPAPGGLYVNDVGLQPNLPGPPQPIVAGTRTVKAAATDATSGVDRVEWWVDGKLRHTDAASPYEFRWEAGKERLGEHTLEARAFDAAGNTASHQRKVTTVPTTPEGVAATVGR